MNHITENASFVFLFTYKNKLPYQKLETSLKQASEKKKCHNAKYLPPYRQEIGILSLHENSNGPAMVYHHNALEYIVNTGLLRCFLKKQCYWVIIYI